jgi:hypothetical protein
VEGLKSDPPKLFFSKKPAVLVNVDGDPIWSSIPSNDLKFAVNTNWDLFSHEPTRTLYLRNEQGWLKATALEGPWTPAGTLPPSFGKLPADENWKEVKAALPGKPYTAATAPVVFTATAPAEMILLTGEPKYVPVPTPLFCGLKTRKAIFSGWARPERCISWSPAVGSARPSSRDPGRLRR